MRKEGSVLGVIVWSQGHVEAFHPVTGKWKSGSTVAEATSGGGYGEVVLALSRRTVMVRTTRLPDTSREAARSILTVRFEQIFPLAANMCAYDFEFTDDKNSEGRLAMVACVRSLLLAEAIADTEKAGLRIAQICPAASGSIAFAAAEGQTTAAVVDPTAEGLGIDLISNGVLHLSRLTTDPGDHAEREAEAIRSYSSMNMERSAILHVRANQKRPEEYLSTGGTAINLEPPELVQKRARAIIDRRKSLALLVWVAAIGYGAVLADDYARNSAAVEKKRTETELLLKELRSEEARLSAKLAGATAAANALANAVTPKQRFADVSVVFSTLAPTGVWLTGLTMERGKLVTVRGTAVSNDALAVFLKGLAKQSRFRDSKLVFANNALIEKTNVVNFSVSAHIVGNFPLGSSEASEEGGEEMILTGEVKKWTQVLIGAMAVCVLLLLFQLFGPKPASQAAAWNKEKKKLQASIDRANEELPPLEETIHSRAWEEAPDQLGATIMSSMEGIAKRNGMTMAAFRPQKTEEDSGLVRYGYSVSVTGRFPQLVEFLRGLETPDSKIAVVSTQIAATDGATDAVSATIAVAAFRKAEDPTNK